MSVARWTGAMLALAIVATPGDAFACSCKRDQTSAERDALADVIFRGRVTSTREGRHDANSVIRITMRVTQRIKGELPNTVTVITRASRTACGVGRPPNGAVVKYRAFRDGAVLRTSVCINL